MRGATAAQGASGGTGSSGERGPAGTTGSTGGTGEKGATGSGGTTGQEGATGKAGVDGAVAGYSAIQVGSVNITSGKEVLILSKTLPAGHYLVSAKVNTSAQATGAGLARINCYLLDGGAIAEMPTKTRDLGDQRRES